MPIDIQTIAGYLESHSLKFQMSQSETGEFIHTVFSTQRYENTQGINIYICTSYLKKTESFFVWFRQIVMFCQKKVFNEHSLNHC